SRHEALCSSVIRVGECVGPDNRRERGLPLEPVYHPRLDLPDSYVRRPLGAYERVWNSSCVVAEYHGKDGRRPPVLIGSTEPRRHAEPVDAQRALTPVETRVSSIAESLRQIDFTREIPVRKSSVTDLPVRLERER